MYALLLNHKTSKSNSCLKLLSCERNFVSRNFFGPLPREPPKIRPQKFNFLNGSSQGTGCFDNSRYLAAKYFEIGWGTSRRPPKNQLFEWLNQGCYCCDIGRYLTDKYFDIVWGTNPQRPPKWTPRKVNFLESSS